MGGFLARGAETARLTDEDKEKEKDNQDAKDLHRSVSCVSLCRQERQLMQRSDSPSSSATGSTTRSRSI